VNRRRVGILLTVIGLLTVVGVSAAVYFLTSEAERVRQSQPQRWVAVAALDIPERAVIGSSQVSMVLVPDTLIPPGAAVYTPGPDDTQDQIDQGKQSAAARVENQFTAQRIYRGEVINTVRLGREAARGAPAFEIPSGKVWYHFPVRLSGRDASASIQLAAFLDAVKPGDFVDFYYSTIEAPAGPTPTVPSPTDQLRGVYTRRLLENVKVVNVGYFPLGTATPRDDHYLTLEVTSDEVLVLKWLRDAATITGNLELVLRSPLDRESAPSATVDFDLVSRRFGIGTGR
jgi:Flp pilus assembly protein CpaB